MLAIRRNTPIAATAAASVTAVITKAAARKYLGRSSATSLALAIGCAFGSLNIASTAYADSLDDAARKMFDDLGAVSNVTGAQAFKGQTANTYTGGSLFIRTPNKTYQLYDLTFPSFPSVSASACGGINAHGGSFSHINSAEFKNMMKTITSAVPGLIFKMAIDSVEPLLGSSISQFKEWESKINLKNIDSCEKAKWLVGTASDKLGASSQSMCISMATQYLGLDAAEANIKCKKASGPKDTLNDSRSNKAIAPFSGNLAWAATAQFSQFDYKDRELLMSITGTTVFAAAVDDNTSAPKVIPPTIYDLRALLYGTASGTVLPGYANVSVLTCNNEYVNCLTPTAAAVNIQSLKKRVSDIMLALNDKIKNGIVPPSQPEIDFVQSVPAPVYQLLSVANATKNPGFATAYWEPYTEYIAVEFAHGLLSRMTRESMQTSNAIRYKLTDAQAPYLTTMQDNANRMLLTLNDERAAASERSKTSVAMAESIAQFQRTMSANLSQKMKDMLAFSGYKLP